MHACNGEEGELSEGSLTAGQPWSAMDCGAQQRSERTQMHPHSLADTYR